jgi:hypothetical protein
MLRQTAPRMVATPTGMAVVPTLLELEGVLHAESEQGFELDTELQRADGNPQRVRTYVQRADVLVVHELQDVLLARGKGGLP